MVVGLGGAGAGFEMTGAGGDASEAGKSPVRV